jgi:molybdate transport system ATP-binding protein
LLHELALPAVLVTHDFEDAAVLADQVGVIVDGCLRQFATPSELVDRPTDAFVASFTGANLLRGTARRQEDGITLVQLETGELVYSTDWGEGNVGVVVYPWEVSVGRLHQEDSAMNLIQGEIRSVVNVGNRVRVRVGPITAEVTAASAEKLELARGGTAFATFKATGTRIVPLASTISPASPPSP